MFRTMVTSPDRPTFSEVSKLLSRNGVSVSASSNTTLTHVVTSKVTEKLTSTLQDLGATVEQTV